MDRAVKFAFYLNPFTHIPGMYLFIRIISTNKLSKVPCALQTPASGISGTNLRAWSYSPGGCVAYTANETECNMGVAVRTGDVFPGRYLKNPFTKEACAEAMISCPAKYEDKSYVTSTVCTNSCTSIVSVSGRVGVSARCN